MTIPLPEYTLRYSKRAKHVHLKISLHGELEIVVPLKFDTREIPKILRSRCSWIEETTARFQNQRKQIDPDSLHCPPHRLQLRAIREIWRIQYQRSNKSRSRLTALEDQILCLDSDAGDSHTIRKLLGGWLRQTARERLAPWLKNMSEELGLPYHRTTIRGQQTLWGSCSAAGNISINYKLLFLPPELVEYVFVHELCHTRHLDHSRHFWSLVQSFQPDYQSKETALRETWRLVPLCLSQRDFPVNSQES